MTYLFRDKADKGEVGQAMAFFDVLWRSLAKNGTQPLE
jgi:hypothetical protein